MGIRRIAGNDATAARRLARSGELPTNARADEEPRRSSIEKLRPGSDPREAIGRLYREGRRYPYGKPPHEYETRERTPAFRSPQPGMEDERASYALGRNSPMKAPNESSPQFTVDKTGDRCDTREGWQRGYGSESPHPHFDSGPSGHRYDRK
jgi:hypothetical protein